MPEMSLSRTRGCGTVLLVIFISAWVIAFSGVDLLVRWSIEQSLYESSVGIEDLRWLVHLVYGIVLMIPLVPLYFAIKLPRIKIMLRLWIIAGIFVILTVPVKMLYLSAQTETTIIISAALLLMIIALTIFKKSPKKSQSRLQRSSLLGVVALVGLGLSTPWLLWGSLGSVLDTVLVIALGVIFGVFISKSVLSLYLEQTQPVDHIVKTGEYAFDGFVVAVFLLVMVTGLSQNGSQLLLVLTLPVSGWLITAFSAAGRQKRDHGKWVAGFLSGILLSLPILFFDTDELSLVISGSEGEVIHWANQAGSYTILFLLIAGIYFLFLFRFVDKMNIARKWSNVVAFLGVIGFAAVYIIFGRPGFFGDQLFVVFKDQADLTQIDSIEPLQERKVDLYKLLTQTSNTTQVNLRSKLDKWGVEYKPYYLVNGLEVNGGIILRLILNGQPGVDRILDSPHLRPLPREVPMSKGEASSPPEGTLWNLEMINVPQVHEELGITGTGIIIGQTDSGVDGTHSELRDSYRGAGTSDDFNWLDVWNKSTSPVDIGGHGTGTLGIEVGATRGIAPGAQWIGCVNLARNLGNPALYLDCMQFMFAPYPLSGDPFTEGDTTKAAMIVNNSWGCPEIEGCDVAVFEPALRALKAGGIFMSVSAGNAGYYGCSTITDPPAISPEVLTVGSVDKAGQLSTFSSLGPVSVDGSNRSKPDLLAPGDQILLAAPQGTYTFASGTSFSAPHVSGVVALMWSANPDLIGDIETTTRILLETAQPYNWSEPECGNGNYGSGAGILDAYAAVKAALGVK